MADLGDGQEGQAGQEGQGAAGAGGHGGKGGQGRRGIPGATGATGSRGPRGFDSWHTHRHGLTVVAFVVLVVLIPIFGGIGWMEHQRNEDLHGVESLARLHAIGDDWELHDALVAACQQANVVRERQNQVLYILRLRLPPAAILDCHATVPRPSSPRLTPDERRKLEGAVHGS